MNEYENGRYLPILYMIPRWNLIRKIEGKLASYELFDPLSGNWYNNKWFVRKAGYLVQEWYDRWILNITVPSERPECQLEGCKNKAIFRWVTKGYATACCPLHSIQSFHKRDSYRENDSKSRKNLISKGYLSTFELSRFYPDRYERMVNKGGYNSGWYESKKFGKMYLDSSYEFSFVKYIESLEDNNINLYVYKGYIRYVSPDRVVRKYFPDFYMEINEIKYIIEIKPNSLTKIDTNICKFLSAIVYFESRGYKYVILTEDYLYPKEGNQRKEYYGKLEL